MRHLTSLQINVQNEVLSHIYLTKFKILDIFNQVDHANQNVSTLLSSVIKILSNKAANTTMKRKKQNGRWKSRRQLLSEVKQFLNI